jgi:hypothetical protein
MTVLFSGDLSLAVDLLFQIQTAGRGGNDVKKCNSRRGARRTGNDSKM